MPRRVYRSNTRFDRRKLRRQALYNGNKYKIGQKAEYYKMNGLAWVIVIGLVIVVLFIIVASGHVEIAWR